MMTPPPSPPLSRRPTLVRLRRSLSLSPHSLRRSRLAALLILSLAVAVALSLAAGWALSPAVEHRDDVRIGGNGGQLGRNALTANGLEIDGEEGKNKQGDVKGNDDGDARKDGEHGGDKEARGNREGEGKGRDEENESEGKKQENKKFEGTLRVPIDGGREEETEQQQAKGKGGLRGAVNGWAEQQEGRDVEEEKSPLSGREVTHGLSERERVIEPSSGEGEQAGEGNDDDEEEDEEAEEVKEVRADGWSGIGKAQAIAGEAPGFGRGHAVPCPASNSSFCLNGGTCHALSLPPSHSLRSSPSAQSSLTLACTCPLGFQGVRCEEIATGGVSMAEFKDALNGRDEGTAASMRDGTKEGRGAWRGVVAWGATGGACILLACLFLSLLLSRWRRGRCRISHTPLPRLDWPVLLRVGGDSDGQPSAASSRTCDLEISGPLSLESAKLKSGILPETSPTRDLEISWPMSQERNGPHLKQTALQPQETGPQRAQESKQNVSHLILTGPQGLEFNRPKRLDSNTKSTEASTQDSPSSKLQTSDNERQLSDTRPKGQVHGTELPVVQMQIERSQEGLGSNGLQAPATLPKPKRRLQSLSPSCP